MVSRIERVPIFTRRRLAAALLILDAGPLPPICISGEKGSLWCCASASVPEIQSHGEARESQLQGRRGGGSGAAGIRWKRATGGRIAPPAHLSMSSARSPWFTLCPASSQKPSTTARFATSLCGTHAFHLTSLAVGGNPPGKRRYLHEGSNHQ